MDEEHCRAAIMKGSRPQAFLSSRWSLIFLALLAAAVIAIYANSLGGPFVWDDEGIIKESAYIAQRGSIGQFFSPDYWREHASYYRYRPLRAALFALEYSLWGFNPKGYHAVNILFHLANVLLLYAAARSIVKESVVAFFTALIFAVHPVHSESVAYVKNATDLLAMMSILLSFMAFKKSFSFGCTSGISAALGAIFYLISILFFILALFSKEMAISAPFLILVYIYIFARKEIRKRLYSRVAPFFAVAAAYGYFLLFVISQGRGPGFDLAKVAFLSRVGLFFKTLAYYGKILFLPTPLNADALLPVPISPGDAGLLVSAVLVVVMALVAFGLFKRSKWLFFALSWAVITILPVSNLALISGRLVAEERLYIPAAGYAAFITIAGLSSSRLGSDVHHGQVGRLKFLGMMFLVAIAFLFSAETVARNNIWKDEITLWTNTVSRSPGKTRPHYNLGVAFMKIGHRSKALAQYKIALGLSRTAYYKGYIYNSMGVWLADMGFEDRGVENFKKALLFKPLEAAAHYNLGDLLVKKGRLNQGIVELQKAILADPTLAEPYNNLSATYGEQRQLDRSIREAKMALLFDRDNAKAYNNLATALGSLNYVQRAVLTYKRSLAADPHFAEPHLGLGAIFLNRLKDEGRAQYHLAAWERLSRRSPGKSPARRLQPGMTEGDPPGATSMSRSEGLIMLGQHVKQKDKIRLISMSNSIII